jgi:dTDP-L-rhamnose 4-epimerase
LRTVIDVVLPALDEEAALPRVLASLPSGYVPIVVDNGSSDATAERARSLGATVVHEPVRGFGAACFAGLRASTSDVVCFMDCDASLDGGDLPRVTAPIVQGRADLVLGARRPVIRSAWPRHARIANRVLARVASRRSGVALTDIGPMRAARRVALLELETADRRCGWPLEMVLRAARSGWRLAEVPVGYEPRVGRSKVTGSLRGTALAIIDMTRALT